MNLPGVCGVCRRPIVWTGKAWRDTTDRRTNRHRCPEDRPTCGAMMRYAGERCARKPGHTTEHRTAYALENAARMRSGFGTLDGATRRQASVAASAPPRCT